MKIRRLWYLLFLFFAYIYCVRVSPPSPDDPGIGWHLADGFWILTNYSVPRIDPFLSIQRPWISDQWLSDLLLSVFYRVGGWPLLSVMMLLLFGAVFFLVLYSFGRAAQIASIPLIVAGSCFAKLATVHLIVRPVVFSFVFFGVIYGSLIVIARRNSFEIGKKTTLLSLMVFLLWANMHPSFVLGLSIIGLLIVGSLIEKFCNEVPIPSRFTETLLLLFVGSVLVTVINPYGIRLHESILWLSKSDFFLNLNDEWKPIQAQSPEGSLFLFVLFLYFSSSLVLLKGKSKVSVFENLTFLLFTCLTFKSVRFLPYLCIVGTPVLASSLEGIVYKFAPQFHVNWPAAWEGGTFMLLATVLVVVTLINGRLPLAASEMQYAPSRGTYPYELLETIRTTFKDAPSVTIYNHPNLGGFITWEGKGWMKPMIDDRNTLLGEEPYRNFFKSLEPSAHAADFRDGATAFLLRKKDLQKQCDPLAGLKLLQETDQWILAQ